jgi:hypothetical protein
VFARVTTFQGKPETFDEGTRITNSEVIPAAQKIPGFKGGYWLGDRKTGKGYAITFWASQEELEASAQTATQLRSGALQKLGATLVAVETFEVTAQA